MAFAEHLARHLYAASSVMWRRSGRVVDLYGRSSAGASERPILSPATLSWVSPRRGDREGRGGRAARHAFRALPSLRGHVDDLCEHVFALSIKGRSHTWLLAAIRRGDLAGVRAAAAELGHQVNLGDALSIVLVMADYGDRHYDRAAARWLARLAYERPGVGLADLRFGLTALEALPYEPDAAKRQLAELCGHQRLQNVIGLLS